MPKRSEKVHTITIRDLWPSVLSLYEVKPALDCCSMTFIPRDGTFETIILRRTGKSHFRAEISGTKSEKETFGSFRDVNNFLYRRHSGQMRLA